MVVTKTFYLIFICIIARSYCYLNFQNERDSCGFSCWLGNLTITVPDISVVEYGFNFTITGMTCSQMTIGGLNSSYIPPTSLLLFPNGVGLECSANWAFQEQGFPYLSGSGGVQVAVSNSAVILGVDLEQNNNSLANAAIVSQCSTVIDVSSIEFSGGILSEILDWFKDLIKSQLSNGLDSVICTQLTQLIEVNLTTVLQQINTNIEPYLVPPPAPVVSKLPGIVNLQNNSIVSLLTYMIHDTLGPEGILSMNDLVHRFLNGSGNYTLTPDQLSKTIINAPIPNLANITFGFLNLSISGLDTFSELSLSPLGYFLIYDVKLDNIIINATAFINVTTNSSIVAGGYLYEEAQVQIIASENSVNGSLSLYLLEDAIKKLKGTQLEEIGCLLRTINETELIEVFLQMAINQATITALGGDVEQDIDATLDNILALFTSSFGPAIPAFLNGYAVPPAIAFANEKITELRNQTEANYSCPAPVEKSTISKEGTIIAFGSTGFIFVLITTIAIIAQGKKYFENKKKGQLNESSRLLYDPPPKIDEEENHDPALIFHDKIPFILRYGIVLLILFNIGTFVSSNTSVGANVFIVLSVNDTHIELPSVFSFSLVNSVRDMWNAKVYALSLLVAVFSGSWPYVKLLILLFCWLTPPAKLPLSYRENLLMFVDKLGKWSLIDAYVLILMMVAFRFHVTSPEVQSQIGVVDAYVQPEFAFYSFLFATMLSLTLGHVILGLHDKTVSTNKKVEHHDRDSLANHTFHTDNGTYTCTGFGKTMIVLMLLITGGLITAGSILYSFAFEFKGATGYILELDNRNPKTSYSMITLGNFIPDASQDPNSVGVRWIQLTFFTFVLGVPLAHITVLLFLWLVPLTTKTKKRVFVLTEVLNAWSALEVFVISIMAALLEIRQFAQFIVGDKCNLVNQILSQYFDNLLNGDDRCFDVIATLDKGCWILFAACVIYLIVATIVMKTCYQALHEKEEKIAINEFLYEPVKKGSCMLNVGKALRLIRI